MEDKVCTVQKLGEHEATLQSLHKQLSDLKHMLERFQDEHREEQRHLQKEITLIEHRMRSLERFKTGCYWIGSAVTATGGILAAWLKNGGST